MAEDNHTQMLIQQQPNTPQQSQLQPAQLQQTQMQQPQLQQSQMQQSQLQQSQLQQSQIQQSQMQQSQLQQSQLQQSQLHQTQLQHSQLQQTQIQQPQLQPTQMQQQSQMQPQNQQQTVTATMSLGSTVEQSNMNVTTSVPINVATINVSQPQQMQTIQQNVNTSSGTPVQMAVPQLTAQAQTLPAGSMMSQSSGPHPTMMHPTMTMAQAPLQQVQVIQQPLSASYLQHLYTPQQQMLFPGNLTLQHTGMGTPTLQSLGATPGLSLQLQAKTTLDPKSSPGQNIQAVNAANKSMAGTMMTASGQIIGPAPKTNFPQQMMAPGKSAVIHSQSGFAPQNTNQTVVIGQLGVLPNQQSIFNHKALTDSQKGKTYTFQNQPTALQPKSLYSSAVPVHSSAQVFNGSHLKQISSQPQIITTQAPGAMFSQAQLLGLQALAPLPPGLSFAAPGCLQSTLLGQNPIIIRSQQSDMIIQQSQPQTAMHLPVAAATAQPVPPTSYAATPVAPQKLKQPRDKRLAIQAQTVAVATQTNVSNAATVNSNTVPVRTQIKPKVRPSSLSSASPSPAPQMATTQTQTNQSPPQPAQQLVPHPAAQQKSDAGNQTNSNQVKPPTEMKSSGTQSKSVSVETKQLSPPQKSQAMVAPSAKVIPATVASTISVTTTTTSTSMSTVTTTVASTSPVMTAAKVQVNASVSTSDASSSTVPSVSSVLPVPKVVENKEPEFGSNKRPPEVPTEPVVNIKKTEQTDAPVESEHLKPQQPILKSPLGQIKDKQPQKAIVKPQVLTHVIDGFVIQEGPEPFPVSRSALLDSPCRILPSEKPDSNQKRRDSPTVASPEKKIKVHRARGNVELAKCEFCLKLGPKSKFKRSKRFCSNTCAKRFNACSSKRVGSLPSAIQEHVASGPGRKRKIGFRGRKSLRKQAPVENESMDTSQTEENISAPDDESSVSNKTEEENSEPPIDSPHHVNPDTEKDDLVVKTESSVTQKLPTKWTVQDVFEFIRDLPGCSDYADTFKSQEIDGQALLLLKEDHLMTAMCMKLGPALKLISQIKTIKEELGHS